MNEKLGTKKKLKIKKNKYRRKDGRKKGEENSNGGRKCEWRDRSKNKNKQKETRSFRDFL
jgi:hypothetical protein